MVGVAVKVTLVLAQMGFAEGVTLTLTGNKGLTVMVTGEEVDGLPVGQVALEVRTTVTTSLLTGM